MFLAATFLPATLPSLSDLKLELSQLVKYGASGLATASESTAVGVLVAAEAGSKFLWAEQISAGVREGSFLPVT